MRVAMYVSVCVAVCHDTIDIVMISSFNTDLLQCVLQCVSQCLLQCAL